MKFIIEIVATDLADLQQQLAKLSPTVTVQPPAGEAPAPVVTGETTPVAAPAAAPALTVEAVRKRLNPYLDGHAGPKIKALCGEYSKKGLPGIPADKLQEYLDKALALVNDGEASA